MNSSSETDYRPHYHFSPAKGWMNDPNGLLYLDGIWHLFFQYYPCEPIHGPMHWGHATSPDLVSWEQQPTALCPQGPIQIFSGSAVVDYQNTSGFGTAANPPVVAIYTAHDVMASEPEEEEKQALAYSLDGCLTWTHYEGNPVLASSSLHLNFRDPKVFWYAPGGHWLMVLAVGNRVHFYSSPDLKGWTFLSEFGADCGAHGGVWECPDLFPLPVQGCAGEGGEQAASEGEKWVLLVSVNPGGPNPGSATQYFVGDFDGTAFSVSRVSKTKGRGGTKRAAREESGESSARWVDWGRDNYAGVLFNNVPVSDTPLLEGEASPHGRVGSMGLRPRRIMIGWMSNWDYAANLPSRADGWLGQMTIARELSLVSCPEGYVLKSYPVQELFDHLSCALTRSGVVRADSEAVLIHADELDLSCAVISVSLANLGLGRTTFTLRNGCDERLFFGIDNAEGSAGLFVDRRYSGSFAGDENFAEPVMTAPLFGGPRSEVKFLFVLDKTSVEIFVDEGLRVMTALFFPKRPFIELSLGAAIAGATFSLEADEPYRDKHGR
ncbi:hypothetical protein AXK11_00345 [Cephaloticoccus primus]|uniref:Glycosyl hydrolase family 32 n=1 Tax=Cephaloticoccus primus TaxID=1548207 RepID=A0A139ST02_9BACT|nr:glycoside hydrolase family 32 protein [Cephaloticoccus primus]KXU37715.1 hypothetical protein AXK11_00345 [Cephaloticoccus primus]